MPERRRSPISNVGAALLGVLAILLPAWRGGVGPGALLLASVVAPLALLLVAWRNEGLPWPALALALVAVLTGLQLAPVAPALHGLSPAARSLFDTVLTPLGLYPAARPLSLDPPATARDLALACAGLAAFCAAWSVGAGRRARSLVLLGMGAAGLLVPVLLLGRALLRHSPVLQPVAPFVNPNHLAGFSNLSAFLLLGLAMREHGAARLAGLTGFGFAALPVFLSLSRGGLAAFLVGTVLFAMLLRRRRPASTGERARASLAPPIAATLAVLLALAGWLSAGAFQAKVENRGAISAEEKVALWPLGVAMVRDYPLVGVGRGAFEVAFPAYKTEPTQVTFTHLENEWLQAVIDLGLPGGLLLLGALALVWLAAARRTPLSISDAGLLAGTAALALQNLVDFSLRIPGVAIPFMVALGLAARGGLRLAARPWVVGALAVLLLVAGAGGAALAWGRSAADDAAALAAAPTPEAVMDLAREAADRHPADFLPHATAGVRLVQAGRCAEAMPWLNRAMLLNPTSADAHLHVARCLAAARQREVARREYRLAATYGSSAALPEALRRFPALEDLLKVAPATPDGLIQLGNLLGLERPTDAAEVYRQVMEEYQDQRPAAQRAAQLLRAEQPEEALRIARERAQAAPREVLAWRVCGQALFALNRPEEAEVELRRGLAANTGAPALLSVLGEQALAARRFSEARRLAEEMVVRTPRDAYQRHMLAARALSGQDKPRDALDQARAALAALPDTWPAMSLVARFAEQVGRYEEAVEVLEQARRLSGQVPENLEDRIQALREAQVMRDARRAAQREAP